MAERKYNYSEIIFRLSIYQMLSKSVIHNKRNLILFCKEFYIHPFENDFPFLIFIITPKSRK